MPESGSYTMPGESGSYTMPGESGSYTMPGESGSYTMPGESGSYTMPSSETAFGSDTITGAVSIETDDGSVLTLTVAEAGVFYMNMVGIENGYEIVDGGPEVMSASQSMLAGAVSITVEDVTVDEAMGLVTLQNMPGVDNLDFSIAGDESLSDLSLMQATAAVEATNVVAGDVSVKDSALIIFSGNCRSILLACCSATSDRDDRSCFQREPDDLPHAG